MDGHVANGEWQVRMVQRITTRAATLDNGSSVAVGWVVVRRPKWKLGVRIIARLAAVRVSMHDADVCKRAVAQW